MALQRERAEAELRHAKKAEVTPVRSPDELPLKKRRGRPSAVGAEVQLGAARKMEFGNMSEETRKANEARSAKLRSMLQEKADDADQDSSNLFGDETAELLNDVVGAIVDRLDQTELEEATVSNVNVPSAPAEPPAGILIPLENEKGEVIAKIMFDEQGNITTQDGSQPPEIVPIIGDEAVYVNYDKGQEKGGTNEGHKEEENELDRAEKVRETEDKGEDEITAPLSRVEVDKCEPEGKETGNTENKEEDNSTEKETEEDGTQLTMKKTEPEEEQAVKAAAIEKAEEEKEEPEKGKDEVTEPPLPQSSPQTEDRDGKPENPQTEDETAVDDTNREPKEMTEESKMQEEKPIGDTDIETKETPEQLETEEKKAMEDTAREPKKTTEAEEEKATEDTDMETEEKKATDETKLEPMETPETEEKKAMDGTDTEPKETPEEPETEEQKSTDETESVGAAASSAPTTPTKLVLK